MILGLTFEIAEGGFLDIDVRITGPNGVNIYQGERETSGKYSFAAHTSGVYTYCFSNKMSTMTPKVVMFNMAIGEAPKAEAQEGESANKLEDMITELSGNKFVTKTTLFWCVNPLLLLSAQRIYLFQICHQNSDTKSGYLFLNCLI